MLKRNIGYTGDWIDHYICKTTRTLHGTSNRKKVTYYTDWKKGNTWPDYHFELFAKYGRSSLQRNW